MAEVEKMKAYHEKWTHDDLMKARGDGIVIDEGEAWRYEFSHLDDLGHYDLWYRPQDPLAPTVAEDRSLRDWFAGQALSNPAICTGSAPEWQLAEWFGTEIAISRARIAAFQAYMQADAMLAARTEGE